VTESTEMNGAVEPTEVPVEPTEAAVELTQPPVTADVADEPTEAPVEPTEVPVEPTEAPGEPTEAAVELTPPPVTADVADLEAPAREHPVTGSGAGTGRRKESVARVRLLPGTGRFELNGRSVESYFPSRAHRMEITAPLRLVGLDKDLDVWARLDGGGVSGQAGALRHGIARALIEYDPGLRATRKREGFLSRDSREKERRKYGLKKARKAPQYSKR
jgi:small subunit ribosomal protein S9